jgi:putative ABC transport system permease protein
VIGGGRSLGERVFAALLRLLPREFRDDFGESMAADVDERSAADRRAIWRRELPALLAAAGREHVSIFRRDVEYTRRTMCRAPGFTALALLMLAVGTGANVAMFSVIDAVMVRSPFREPDRSFRSFRTAAAGRAPCRRIGTRR